MTISIFLYFYLSFLFLLQIISSLNKTYFWFFLIKIIWISFTNDKTMKFELLNDHHLFGSRSDQIMRDTRWSSSFHAHYFLRMETEWRKDEN